MKRKKDYILVPNTAMSREELEIAHMAADLKAAFRDKWLSVYGRPYSKNPRADNQTVWQHAAENVIAVNGTAATYVEAQFTMSKTICLPTKLVGPSAMKRYRSYLISQGIDILANAKDKVDSSDRIDPGKAELREMLAAHTDYITSTYGISDLKSKVHRDIVMQSPWLFNGLAVFITMYPDEEVCAMFKDDALAKLTEYPYLKDSMKEMGYKPQLNAILQE